MYKEQHKTNQRSRRKNNSKNQGRVKTVKIGKATHPVSAYDEASLNDGCKASRKLAPVSIEEIPIEHLKPNEQNPRRNDPAVEAVGRSILA